MRLLVVALLQPVLDPPQEAIGVAELLDRMRREQLLAREQRQRLEQAARLQRRLAAASDQLERLHDELDLADAARAELDVVAQVATLDLARDQLLHVAQRLEHAEVEVAAEHERPQHVAVQLVERRGAVHRARLDVGVALPVATVLLQVVLEGVEADDLGAGFAERPQPQVHAIHEAVGRHGAEQLRDAPAEPREVLLVLHRARTHGLAVRGEQEHEVDVGGEVELAAAELAHAEHHELERLAVLAPRHAVANLERRGRPPAGGVDANVGQQRELAEHRLDVREAGEVAPRDAHQVAAAEAAQDLHEAGVVVGRPEAVVEVAREAVRGHRPGQPAGLAQPRQQRLVAQAGLGRKVAAGPHQGEAARDLSRALPRRQAAARVELRKPLLEGRAQQHGDGGEVAFHGRGQRTSSTAVTRAASAAAAASSSAASR